MKIVVGKITKEPFHGLSKRDLLAIFKVVPASWTAPIETVIFSAQILAKRRTAPRVIWSPDSQQLTLHCRDVAGPEIVESLLTELAKIGLDSSAPETATSGPQLRRLMSPYRSKALRIIS
jgi:hypothetical protein